MGDEEAATLDSQFLEFAKLNDNKRSGETITVYRSDIWMRQARVLDDRRVTMTDTGRQFFKWDKTELNFDEWQQYLADLCLKKGLDEDVTRDMLTNCGLPGQTPIVVPQYRDYYLLTNPERKRCFERN